jgi:hypothetical protein
MKENTRRGERRLEYLGDVTGKMVDTEDTSSHRPCYYAESRCYIIIKIFK